VSNTVKIIPSSSLIEISGSFTTGSRIDVTGSALTISYITPTANDSIDTLKIRRKHPLAVEASAATCVQVGYYGKAKLVDNLDYAKDIYILKTTGSSGFDSTVSFKKQLYSGATATLVNVEKKTPGTHEEFELNTTLNEETFYKRTYLMVGQTVGNNSNAYLSLVHTNPPQPYIEINENESVQLVAHVIGRAGDVGVRSRAFIINGYADTLDAAGTIDGNYVLVNSVGQAATAPPNGWNVQIQFVDDYAGGDTNYIQVQVFNNSFVNEVVNWTAYIELTATVSSGTIRYGGI
jgi:hypothetical protein